MAAFLAAIAAIFAAIAAFFAAMVPLLIVLAVCGTVGGTTYAIMAKKEETKQVQAFRAKHGYAFGNAAIENNAQPQMNEKLFVQSERIRA